MRHRSHPSLLLIAVVFSAGSQALAEPVVTEVKEGTSSILSITATDGAESVYRIDFSTRRSPATKRTDLIKKWESYRLGAFVCFNSNQFSGVEICRATDPQIYSPQQLDVAGWIAAFKQAGMKYAVLTVRHTSGFLLWPSPTTDFDVASSGNTTNVCREFVGECRRQGIVPAFYYCLWGGEWNPDPNARAVILAQLYELATQYGEIPYFWMDMMNWAPPDLSTQEIYDALKSLQPNAVVIFNQHVQDGTKINYFPTDVVNGELVPPPTNGHDPRRTIDGTTYHLPFEYSLVSQSREGGYEYDPIGPSCWFTYGEGKDFIPSRPFPAEALAEQIKLGYDRGAANVLLATAPDHTGRMRPEDVAQLRRLGEILAAEGRVFHVRDFGAVPDGEAESGDAIRAAIAAAIAAAGTAEAPVEVVLDAGTYRVRHDNPRHGYCFPIHQAAHLTVRGAGPATKIVIADPTLGGFQFGMGQQVTLRDLVIDYDPLPFCQGTIRAVDVEQGTFDLEIAAGYPTPDAEHFVNAHEPYGKWGMIMDPATRRIRAGTPDHTMTPRWEHREGRVWRFFTATEHYRQNLQHMRVGDAYVHLARGFGSAVTAQGCDGVRIENVTVHASPGLAVGLIANRGEITVRKLQVRFAPDSDRLLTTDADGVHCQQNRNGPVIEDCYFEGMADDAINIYAPPNILREIREPTQWLVSPNCLILPGDRLQVLDPQTGALRGEVKVVGGGLEQRAFLLNVDQPLAGAVAGEDHRSADTLYNIDACGAGFVIRRNHMRGNRRYGCLLRAGNGQVQENLFEDTTGAGVVVTNEPDWPEGPMPWGITIRGNRFLRGGTCLGYADSAHGAALSVRAARLGHGLADAEAIRDIVIDDNEFQDRAGTALFVGGATQVSVVNNRITASLDAPRRRRGSDILIERSSGVTLTDNIVSDLRPDTSAAVEIGSTVAPAEGGVRVSGLSAELAPGTSAVQDRRAVP